MTQNELAIEQDIVERRSLAEQIFTKIKSKILCGELKAGRQISEEALTAMFGVSRTPIREALRRLGEYGLIRIRPRSRMEVILLSDKEIGDVMEVRASLEKLAVQLVSQKATPADLKSLRDIARKCREHLSAGDVSRTFENDSQFHLELARLSGNGALLQSLERLDALVQLARLVHCQSVEAISSALAMHDELVDAMESHDAGRAMQIAERHSRFKSSPGGEKQA